MNTRTELNGRVERDRDSEGEWSSGPYGPGGPGPEEWDLGGAEAGGGPGVGEPGAGELGAAQAEKARRAAGAGGRAREGADEGGGWFERPGGRAREPVSRAVTGVGTDWVGGPAKGPASGPVSGSVSGSAKGAVSDAAEAVRRRAADIFGHPAAEPYPDLPHPKEPRLADPLPGLPVFGEGPLGRLRSWLFVRCGVEFKAVAALAVLLAVAGGLAFQHYWAGRPRVVAVPRVAAAPPPMTSAAPRASPGPAAQVTVDVAGKVVRPGLRRLPKGSRVADALTAAGGPLPGTDTATLNLARPLTDGEQILVGVHPPPAAPAAPAPPGSATATGPVSLSSATPAQLDALPGVGPVLAQHIIDFRTEHGGFTSLQQLRQIPGIGPRKFTTIQPLVQP